MAGAYCCLRLANNWVIDALENQENPGGREGVGFIELAGPVKTPVTGPPQQPWYPRARARNDLRIGGEGTEYDLRPFVIQALLSSVAI